MENNFRTIVNEDIETILASVPSWEHFSGQCVLVTGANGFLGNYFVRTLLALNNRGVLRSPVSVIAGVRNLQKGRDRFSDALGSPELSLLQLDLANITIPRLGQVDYVIHAASPASPKYYGIDPVGTLLPNTVGTAALLAATQASGLKGFLFVSSSEVYGNADSSNALSESTPGLIDPTNIRSCYGESKRMGETMCVAWAKQYAIPSYIVRPFHTYGPGLHRGDGRVFADFVFNVIDGENIVIHGDGRTRRAFCYVSDAVSGIFTVLWNGEVAGAYNVANPSGECAIEELADIIVGLFPERQLQVQRLRNSHTEGYIPSCYDRVMPDINKLVGLGWAPKVAPTDGFKRTIKAYL